MTNDHGAGRFGPQARRPISFTWNGTPMTGAEGDTVASALIANGQRVFTVHPTSGQPRGGFCFVGRCSDCLVVVDGQPGTMACVSPLVDGLRVERQVGHGHWDEDGS